MINVRNMGYKTDFSEMTRDEVFRHLAILITRFNLDPDVDAVVRRGAEWYIVLGQLDIINGEDGSVEMTGISASYLLAALNNTPEGVRLQLYSDELQEGRETLLNFGES